MPNHILVTGGAGFAGSALSIALKRNDPSLRVTAFDNLRRRGSELNGRRLQEAGVDFVHGDVRSPSDLQAVRPAPDLLIECSAEPSAQAGYGGSPAYLIDTNLIGCYNCLEVARTSGAGILFISTSRVYPFGALNALPFTETATRFEPLHWTGVNESFPLAGARSLYGMTKLAAELMLEEYADAYGMKYVINRCGLLTGPYQMAKSDQGVLALWVAAHYFKTPLKYIGFAGTGKQVRDFLHIDDLCALVIDQIAHFERYRNRTFNVGGGRENSLSLLETTALCGEITGNSIPIGSVAENRPADVRIYLSDSSAVSAINGWRPKRDARETLGSIHDWLRREEAVYRPFFA